MRGINKVIIVGNLGNDPETKYSQGGTAITTISVATTDSWKDKDGERQERTEWHRIKFFSRLAEIAGEYLKKGQPVYVEGELRTDKYTDKDGIERYATYIVAKEMRLLAARDDGERSGTGGRGAQRPATDRPRRGAERERTDRGASPQGDHSGRQQRSDDPFPDDDIPF